MTNNNLFSFKKSEQSFSWFLVATIIFYLYKTAFWPLTYLFVVCYFILILIFLSRFDWKFKFLGFFTNFLYPLVLAGIIILAFLVNGHFSKTALKDILLLSVLFSLFYFLYWNNRVLNRDIPIKFSIDLIIFTTAAISVLNLINQLKITILPVELATHLNISAGSTIANDYNFFSLFMLFGLVILNYQSTNNVLSISYPKWFTNALNLIFIVNILLSSSRRGIIILALLIVVYIILLIVKKPIYLSFKKLFKRTIIVSVLLFIIGIVGYQTIPRQKISVIIYRYATLVGINDFNSLERFLWEKHGGIPKDKDHLIDKLSFDPDYSYWSDSPSAGTVISNIETPYGSGIKLFRTGPSIDFSLLYTGPKILYYSDHTYIISFKIKFSKGDFNSFNVGWWVNDGGNGFNAFALYKETETVGDGWYQCTSKYKFIDNHIGLIGFINSVSDQTSFIIADFKLIDLDYNPQLPRFEFEYHGKEHLSVWLDKINQPLNESNLINNGDFSLGLEFWKYSSDSLTVKITSIDSKRCALISRGNGNGANWSLFYVGKNIEFRANNEYQISFKIKPISPKTIPFNVGYWVNEGAGYQIGLKLKIDTITNGWLNVRANYKFKNDQKKLLFPINSQLSNSKFYITDISLINLTKPQYQVKSQTLEVDTIINSTMLSGRTQRWRYAAELWETEYNWYNKLFGYGFKYYEWFGQKFLNDPIRGDYPHNPFISILLYSGICGLAFYFWLLYKVFSLYIYYRKEYGALFICSIITFFFSFFSGNSPFDPPIMGFFVIIPFFIDFIHKNNDQAKLISKHS